MYLQFFVVNCCLFCLLVYVFNLLSSAVLPNSSYHFAPGIVSQHSLFPLSYCRGFCVHSMLYGNSFKCCSGPLK